MINGKKHARSRLLNILMRKCLFESTVLGSKCCLTFPSLVFAYLCFSYKTTFLTAHFTILQKRGFEEVWYPKACSIPSWQVAELQKLGLESQLFHHRRGEGWQCRLMSRRPACSECSWSNVGQYCQPSECRSTEWRRTFVTAIFNQKVHRPR